jgi:hypothetical protein
MLYLSLSFLVEKDKTQKLSASVHLYRCLRSGSVSACQFIEIRFHTILRKEYDHPPSIGHNGVYLEGCNGLCGGTMGCMAHGWAAPPNASSGTCVDRYLGPGLRARVWNMQSSLEGGG